MDKKKTSGTQVNIFLVKGEEILIGDTVLSSNPIKGLEIVRIEGGSWFYLDKWGDEERVYYILDQEVYLIARPVVDED